MAGLAQGWAGHPFDSRRMQVTSHGTPQPDVDAPRIERRSRTLTRRVWSRAGRIGIFVFHLKGHKALSTSLNNECHPFHPKSTEGTGRLKRVLFVLELDTAGKYSSLAEEALSLAREFRKRDSLFLPAFLRPLEGEAAIHYEREGLPVESLDLRQFRLDTLSRLLKVVRVNRIEVIHWNFYYPLNSYLWFVSLLAPWVEHYYTDHNSRQTENLDSGRSRGLKALLKRLLASRYKKTFCVSGFVLTHLERSQWPNLRKLNNFINTERFKPDSVARREVRRSLGVADEFVALIVAWLIKDKGVDVALKALAGMPQNLVLWVVGEGPEMENLQGLAEDLDLGTKVQFLGPRDHVEPLMQAADCLICPSLWAEAAGLVSGSACLWTPCSRESNRRNPRIC